VVFIFATTELQKVPATIRSRCQQFNFRLVSVDAITALLRDACKEMGIQAEDEALFWIARESTGSCRDAYTLFDQVVSFSDGHIRTELIREKLGLVGLEKLNEFAEACAAGDFFLSLSLIDSLLSSGVAVETFVTDLAGYYHNLLLLKAGVTRETVLGYPPSRFSKAVLEKYDTVRLARAGELLFELHRDIRYSVSPRFELETLASKFCWLEKWISPEEMGAAVTEARQTLGGPGRPLAAGLPSGAPELPSPAKVESEAPFHNFSSPSARPAAPSEFSGAPGSLSEEFKRYMASRTNPRQNPGANSRDSFPEAPSANSAESGAENFAKNSGELPSGNSRIREEGAVSPPALDPGVQKVLDVFKGTIIEENRK